MASRMSAGACADFRPWTPADDALVRARYRRGAAEKLATELGRTVSSVRHRARRIGASGKGRWTPSELQELRSRWGEQSLGVIARVLGRPKSSVYWQAQNLALLRVPDGFETISSAAARTGYCAKQLHMILAWAGVEEHTRTSRSARPGHRFHHVDPFDVDEAIERWLKTEPLEAAAERHGLLGAVLRNWMLWAKEAGFDVPPAPARRRVHWRIPSDLADRVVAWRAGLESITQASKRVGIRRQTLTRMLVAAGVQRFSKKPWLVAKSDVDALVGAGRKAA